MSNDKQTPAPGKSPESTAGGVAEDLGKSKAEIEAIDAIEGASEAAKKMYKSGSPFAELFFGSGNPWTLFEVPDYTHPESEETRANLLAITKDFWQRKAMYDADGKIGREYTDAMHQAGYGKLIVPPPYGFGAPFSITAPFLSELAQWCPTKAGELSIGWVIGPTGPLRYFGTQAQRDKLLPELASGAREGFFALTERCAGSSVRDIKTTAFWCGDHWEITGEKWFITKGKYRGRGALVAKVHGHPKYPDGAIAMFIIDLPDQADETFQEIKYDIKALTHLWNNGLRFNRFKVDADRKLDIAAEFMARPEKGDGLIMAFFLLTGGRLMLLANTLGQMKTDLRTSLPWTKYRETMGEAIDTRELVQGDKASMAARIFAGEALLYLTAHVVDSGRSGEGEGIAAKIFGSESKLYTHLMAAIIGGGRTLMGGHYISEELVEVLAQLIYEGVAKMLAMKGFVEVTGPHTERFMLWFDRYMKGIGYALRKRKPLKALQYIYGLAVVGLNYACWAGVEMLKAPVGVEVTALGLTAGLELEAPFMNYYPKGLDRRLRSHAAFGQKMARRMAREFSATMVLNKKKLFDMQQTTETMFREAMDIFSLFAAIARAHKLGDEGSIAVCEVHCLEVRQRVLPERPNNKYFKARVRLAKLIAEGKFKPIAETPVAHDILARYKPDDLNPQSDPLAELKDKEKREEPPTK